MPVPETPDNDVCAICRAEITQDAEDPDERPQFLACGHRFHAICIKAYVGSAGTTIEDIECPNCTLTASDMKDREDSLMADAPGPYDGDPLCGPIDAQDAEDAETIDGEPLSDFEILSAASADEAPSGQGKSKGEGKSQGKGKSKGKSKGKGKSKDALQQPQAPEEEVPEEDASAEAEPPAAGSDPSAEEGQMNGAGAEEGQRNGAGAAECQVKGKGKGAGKSVAAKGAV